MKDIELSFSMHKEVLSETQQEDILRAMDSIVYAWESDNQFTEIDLCNHLEEVVKIFECKSNYKKFILKTKLAVILHS